MTTLKVNLTVIKKSENKMLTIEIIMIKINQI